MGDSSSGLAAIAAGEYIGRQPQRLKAQTIMRSRHSQGGKQWMP